MIKLCIYVTLKQLFYSNDMIQLINFDSRLLKINERENRENNNIDYISYKINKPEHNINSINKENNRENNNIYNISCKINKPEHNINSIINLYFVIDYLCGMIEKIDGSKDRYLVIDKD